ncbi:hypothetical protein [Rhizobium sp. Root1220]|uniref:hypothetical protein n=1 Tax=Rhizobium sp. Root1220 TaxID=1736432 RepID=UPI000701447F|nr:hypothetical protein [Rhizobium sp. Root1220]KQV73027.1 hypothetical protein ASC90_06330 [Rhizobium sp. Root1220]
MSDILDALTRSHELYRVRNKRLIVAFRRATGRLEWFVVGDLKGIPASTVELQPARENEKTRFDPDAQKLWLDGLAITDLLAYVAGLREWKSEKEFWKVFETFFGGGQGIRLASHPRAALAAVFNFKLPGELEYFKRQMIDQHPRAFAELQRGKCVIGILEIS